MVSESFRIYDAYGPFGDLPNRSEFVKKYGVDLMFSGNTNYLQKGAGGSGKSSLLNTLLKYEPNLQYIATGRYVRATVFPSYNLIGIGKYELDRNCGGCDTITSPKTHNPQTFRWIKENLPGYSIEVSGTLVSHLLTPITQMYEVFPNRPVICAYMNTPYEECVRRIKERSNHSEEKTFKSIKSRFDYLAGQRTRYIERGFYVEDIDAMDWTSMFNCYKKIEEKYRNHYHEEVNVEN